MRTITVISPVKGEVKIEPHGFPGTTCLEATRKLESILGGEIQRQATAEMHSAEVTTSVEATTG
jgi:hypothetical protein